MRIVDWDGETAGEEQKTVTDIPLTIQGRRIKARRIKQEDIVASGGNFEDIDYRIGPMTPEFIDPIVGAGGNNVEYFNPPTTSKPREVYYKLTGPGIENGAWFKKIAQEADKNWSYYFIVRKIATSNP